MSGPPNERITQDPQIIRPSMIDQERIADLLLAPLESPPALLRAFEAHRELIRKSK